MQELATAWMKVYGTDTQKYFAAQMSLHPEWINCQMRGNSYLIYEISRTVPWWTRAGRAIKRHFSGGRA